MTNEPQRTHPEKNWRFGLVMGLCTGSTLAVLRSVDKALEPSLGYWGAFPVGILAAVLVGGLVGLLARWLLGRGGAGCA